MWEPARWVWKGIEDGKPESIGVVVKLAVERVHPRHAARCGFDDDRLDRLETPRRSFDGGEEEIGVPVKRFGRAAHGSSRQRRIASSGSTASGRAGAIPPAARSAAPGSLMGIGTILVTSSTLLANPVSRLRPTQPSTETRRPQTPSPRSACSDGRKQRIAEPPPPGTGGNDPEAGWVLALLVP